MKTSEEQRSRESIRKKRKGGRKNRNKCFGYFAKKKLEDGREESIKGKKTKRNRDKYKFVKGNLKNEEKSR